MSVRVRRASIDEAPLVRSIMRQAFAEYADALAVESGADSETLKDVVAAMRAGGAVLAFVGYELVSIDPHPRGPGRVWAMRKPVVSDR